MLKYQWTIWEQYEVQSGNDEDYKKSMRKVASFKDIISFWKIWNNLPHSDPHNFFMTKKDGEQQVQFYKIGEED